jgi:hypothetical protein
MRVLSKYTASPSGQQHVTPWVPLLRCIDKSLPSLRQLCQPRLMYVFHVDSEERRADAGLSLPKLQAVRTRCWTRLVDKDDIILSVRMVNQARLLVSTLTWPMT